MRCVGRFRVERTTCHLLESGDNLYVERGEFIGPLILVQTYYARHGSLPQKSSRSSRIPNSTATAWPRLWPA
jgi:hypothetical protein